MKLGGLLSSALGEVSDIILDKDIQAVAGNTLHAKFLPYAPFAKRFFMPFIGGVYLGNTVREHFGEPIEITATVGANTTGGVYLEDVGDWAFLPDGSLLPDGGALEFEALTSKRLRFEWTNSYNTTDPHGDTQLSNIALTGAVRLQNVGVHPTPTRGRLYYTISINPLVDDSGGDDDEGGDGGTSSTSNNFIFLGPGTKLFTVVGNQVDFYLGQRVRVFRAADHNVYMEGPVTLIAGQDITITPDDHVGAGAFTDWVLVTKSHYDYSVRFFADGRLVSEAAHAVQAISNTASEINSSDLGAAFDLTYTADVSGLTAYFDVRWPAAYALHRSTGALVFPRAADYIVPDNGGDDYAFTTPNLAPGVYNCDVLQIDDEGNTETTGIPVSVAKTINSAPAAPTITSVTVAPHGGGVRLTVNWTNGEAGCTTMIYFSDLDSPVNLFAAGSPTPVGPSAVDATSGTIDLASVPPGIDFTTDYTTALGNIDSSIAALLSAGFYVGESDYESEYPAVRDAIVSVIEAFGVAVGEDFDDQLSMLETVSNSLELAEENASGIGLSTEDWQTAVGPYLAQYMSALGSILCDDPLRYFLDYQFVPLADLISILEQSSPLVRSNFVRIIIRSTKGGIQERHDDQYIVEFDGATGTIVAARPNKPQIEYFSVTAGEVLNLHVSVIEDDAAAAANSVLLYVAADADPFDFTSSDGAVALGAAFGGYHAGDITFTFPGTGWYKFCVRSYNSASGTRSAEPQGDEIKYIYIGQTVGAVRSFAVNVQGGLGIE